MVTCLRPGYLLQQISLVEDGQSGQSLRQSCQNRLILSRHTATGIHDQDQQIRRFNRSPGPGNAQDFDFIGRFPQSGRVDNVQRNTVYLHGLANRVAGSAGDRGYDGQILTRQTIEQLALANIGLPCQNNLQAGAQQASLTAPLQREIQFCLQADEPLPGC